MKKYIISMLLIVSTCYYGHAQGGINELVFNGSYPIAVGDNFIANPSFQPEFKKFMGIYGMGLGYHIRLQDNLFLCLDLRYSYSYRQRQTYQVEQETRVFPSMNLDNLNPSVGIKYQVGMGDFALVPQVNLGYSLMRFYRNFDSESFSFYESQNAFTISARMKAEYSLSDRSSLGVFLAYDNYILDKPRSSAETSFNRKNQWVQYFYPGIEFRHRI